MDEHQEASFSPSTSGNPDHELDPSAEYFDRERWRDVETEDDSSTESEREKKLTFTTLSLAVLLLVALTAGVLGVFTVVTTQRMSALMSQRIENKTDYRVTPSQWVGYGMEHAFFCDVNQPTCFAALGDGTMFIGDAAPPSIRVFSLSGKPIRTIALETEPQSLAVGGPGTAFADRLLIASENRLDVLTTEGKPLTSWKWPSDKAAVWSLALADDAIFAADSSELVVYRFDGTGKLLNEIGRRKKDNSSDAAKMFPGFVVYRSPISLTVSPKTGIVYVANPGKHRIEAFTRDGHWEPSLGSGSESADVTGFAGCCNPVFILALEDGRLVTAEKSITRVKVLHPDGRLEWVVAGPEVLETKPANIPQLADLPGRTVSENNAQPVSIAIVGKSSVLVFDPVLRIVRYFVPLNIQKNGK